MRRVSLADQLRTAANLVAMIGKADDFSENEPVRPSSFAAMARLADDPYASALATAKEIASRSPDAIRAAKRLLNLATSEGAARLLEQETIEQHRLLSSPNQVEAARANREQRTPRFDEPQLWPSERGA